MSSQLEQAVARGGKTDHRNRLELTRVFKLVGKISWNSVQVFKLQLAVSVLLSWAFCPSSKCGLGTAGQLRNP